jgi:hypothetical protein
VGANLDIRTNSRSRTPHDTAFYSVADSRAFFGLVALINSLRLQGHEEPIIVADCGLTDGQRRRLRKEVALLDVPGARAPHLVKTMAPLAHPHDVMVLIDADIIATRPLANLTGCARTGRVVAFADRISHRFEEQWSGLLGLKDMRRRPYVNAGLVIFPRELGLSILEQVQEGVARVEIARTMIADGTSAYPFYYLDQDVLNAVMATFPPQAVEILDHELAPFPPFSGLELIDEKTLSCRYRDGREPFALHHVLRKPWLDPTRSNIYSDLFARLLLGPDVAIRLQQREVPPRFRDGAVGWLERRRCDTASVLEDLRSTLRRLAS